MVVGCQMNFKPSTTERKRTAGFPREHLVIAWKSVDFPTLARPTYNGVKVSEDYSIVGIDSNAGQKRRNPQFHSSNYSRASRA